MRTQVAYLAAVFLAAAVAPAYAETEAERSAMRLRAMEKCKANRGVDCNTESGLREWMDAERARPPNQRAPYLQQKWEAERRAQQREAEGQRSAEEQRARCIKAKGAAAC
jgi:hypothetical protein